MHGIKGLKAVQNDWIRPSVLHFYSFVTTVKYEQTVNVINVLGNWLPVYINEWMYK